MCPVCTVLGGCKFGKDGSAIRLKSGNRLCIWHSVDALKAACQRDCSFSILVRSFVRMTDDCRLEALLLVDQQSRERLRLAAVSMANYRYNVLQRQTHLEERRDLSDDPIFETSSLSGATKKLQSKNISRKSEASLSARKHLIKKRRKPSASRSAQTVRDGHPVQMKRSRSSVYLRS